LSHAATPLFSSTEQTDAFIAELQTVAVGVTIKFLPETASTNDLASAAANNGAPHGAVFIADAQTKGRGRRGRAWQSPPGRGLLLSILLRPAGIGETDLGWISLLAGLAASEAFEKACGVRATIKWPNDVVVPSQEAPGWRKLGGILCESSLSPGSPADSHVIVGVGLNINHTAADFQPADGAPFKAPPTSAAIEANQTFSRTGVLGEVLRCLDARLLELLDGQRRSALKASIEQALATWWTPQRNIVLNPSAGNDAAASITCSFAGLDEFGRLKLRTASGERALADAEILSVE
jgi:BirA family biotin operon repressor/biotin-[acetyl-CoA-carboxylase] ligase